MSTTHTSKEEETPTKTIVVVEDDNSIAEVLVMIIQQETPYQALCFADGFEAWTRIQNRLPLPNLLILDYTLPLITGIELYDHIHARKEYEHIPALIMSVYSYPCQKAAKTRNLVCIDKPFALDDFLNVIERLIV